MLLNVPIIYKNVTDNHMQSGHVRESTFLIIMWREDQRRERTAAAQRKPEEVRSS